MPRIPLGIALVGFLATVAVSTQRGMERGAFDADAKPSRWGMIDFRDTLYYPAVALLAGENPWSERLAVDYPVQRPLPPYGPVVVLLHWPLGLLPVTTAEIAYFAVTIALTMLTAAIALRATGLDAGLASVLVVASLVLLSRPGHQNLLLGQCTLEVVLGCYLALVYGERRPVLAILGIVLASMKPQFALPLVLLLLVRGDRRVPVVGVVTTALVSIGTLVLAGGAQGPATWLTAVGRSSGTVAAIALAWTRIDVEFFVQHILQRPGRAELVAQAIVLAIGLFAFRRSVVADGATGPSPLTYTLACLTILLPLYHIAYDTLLLTLPIMGLLGGARTLPLRAHVVLTLLVSFPFVNYVATHSVIINLVPGEPTWRLATATNVVALLAALAVAGWLALGGRGRSAAVAS